MNKVANKRVSDSGRTFIYCSDLSAALTAHFGLLSADVSVHTEKDTGSNWFFVSVRCSAALFTKIRIYAEGFDAGTMAFTKLGSR